MKSGNVVTTTPNLFEDVFKLRVVLRSVMEADNGCRAYREAYKYGSENKGNVHYYAKGRNTVFSCDLHQLKSEWDTYDGNAVKNAKHEVTYADKDATEQHPKDIS